MALILIPAVVAAQSAWELEKELKVAKTGDSMYMPSAVAFDKKSKRYYVVDTGRSRLVSFGRDGKLITAFTANDQLKDPFDMVRLDNGKLWVVEKGRNSLTFIDIEAKKVEPNTLRDGDRLVFPDRIAEYKGKLYILDRASGQVLRLDKNLSIEQRFNCEECSIGFFDFVIANNSVMAIEPQEKKIYRFNTNNGQLAEVIKLSGKVDFPVSLAVAPFGTIYVLDRHQNSVLVYDQNGQFQYRFLSTGKAPGQVYFARQLRFDPWGNLCVVDEGNGRVEIFKQ
jgi:DNA-binding beta-propeller fold protein YncE